MELSCDISDNEAEQSDGDDSDSDSEAPREKEQAMSLSIAVAEGTVSKKTMRLLGHIGKTQVCILIDSGSSGNFLNSTLVNKLALPVQQLDLVQVTIANGTKMCNTEELPTWFGECKILGFQHLSACYLLNVMILYWAWNGLKHAMVERCLWIGSVRK